MSQVCDYQKLDEILEKHRYDSASIIAILQETQEEYHYLPREAFDYYAQKLKMPIAKIFSIATFYENFSLEPKGKYVIKVCDGTACHVRKSVPVLDRLRKELGLTAGKVTTDDQLFTVEIVSCLGACGLAPAITVNEKVIGLLTPDKAAEILAELKEGESHAKA